MSEYRCEDCDTPYTSAKAAVMCDCDSVDQYGYPVWHKGHDYLP